MKRFLKIVLITLCALTCVVFATACDLPFRLPSSCSSEEGDKEITVEQPILLEDNKTTFTMTMVEKESFYYPTIKGKVNLSFSPSKLEVIVEDNGSFDIAEDDFTNLSYSNNRYIVSFEKVHIFGRLDEGDYTVQIKAYNGDKDYMVKYETVFVVDELYTAFNGVNFETGKPLYAMDKESNWVGPFHENELPIMPITNGGDFVTSEDYFGDWQ